MQFQMSLARLDRASFQTFIDAVTNPGVNNIGNARLDVARVSALGHFMQSRGRPRLSIFLQIEGLQPTLAVLIT